MDQDCNKRSCFLLNEDYNMQRRLFMMQGENKYCYVVVRRDLSYSQQAVQAIHASIEAARYSLITAEQVHPHVILCGVKNAQKLIGLSYKLDQAGIRYRAFFEPDLNNEITALATEPIAGCDKQLFKNIQCLKLGENI